MYIAFNAPHDPRQAPKNMWICIQLIKSKYLKLFRNTLKGDWFGKGLRDALPRYYRTTCNPINREILCYVTYGLSNWKNLDHLNKTGQAENTYVFFTADHGLSVGHHGLLGKQNLYDHSVECLHCYRPGHW